MTTFCLFQSSVFEKFRSHSKSRWSTPEGYTNSQPAVHPPVTSVCNVISVACTACASITCRSVSIRVHMQCLWPGWIRRGTGFAFGRPLRSNFEDVELPSSRALCADVWHGTLAVSPKDDSIDALAASPDARAFSRASEGIGWSGRGWSGGGGAHLEPSHR